MEARAVWDYTNLDYIDINPALRQGNRSVINRYAKRILNIASAVNKSRGKSCKFYRYINEAPGLLEQMSKRGQIFIERGFFSATLDEFMDTDEGEFRSRDIQIVGSECRDQTDYDYEKCC